MGLITANTTQKEHMKQLLTWLGIKYSQTKKESGTGTNIKGREPNLNHQQGGKIKACQFNKISCIEKSINCLLREHHEQAFRRANSYLSNQEDALF